MTVTREPSVLLLDTLEKYPLNEYYSPIHNVDPVMSVHAMAPMRVAVDFYWISPTNKFNRFLCVEADVTGESSDCNDVVMYGLGYSAELGRWWPMYRTLREMSEHEYILLPQYQTRNTVSAALQFLKRIRHRSSLTYL